MFSKKIDQNQKWDPDFPCLSPIFEPLLPWAEKFSHFKHDWPGLYDYQKLLDELDVPIQTLAGEKLKIVQQDGKPGHFNEHYAPRVYFTGEVQTRTENWHDFFQFLTWFMFPKTKAVINSVHVPAAQKRIENEVDLGRRSPVENMLSLFDEGGAVILCSDESLLQLIREFSWKELFWHRRAELDHKLKLVTFGHALYEKGLSPYVGMTANCILFHVDEELIQQNNQTQLDWIDNQLAGLFSEGIKYTKPKDLAPFPLLGLTGWDDDNSKEAYYDNLQYFRSGRGIKQ